MSRDLAGSVLVLVLAVASLFGSAAYLSFALAATAFFALVVVPWVGEPGRGAARVLGVALMAVPFVVYGLLEAPRHPASWLVPAPAWGVAILAGVVIAALPRRAARLVGIGVLTLLALDATMHLSGRGILPRAWMADVGPVVVIGGDPAPASGEAGVVEGVRRGAPTVVTSTVLGEGDGPWLEPAVRGRVQGANPWVMLLDGDGEGVRHEGGAGTFVAQGLVPRSSPLELDAFDAAVVLPGAWPRRTPEAERWADDLAIFARRGGLLLGPASTDLWPEPLGRRLGAAAALRQAGETKPFGLGTLHRVASEKEVRDVLAQGAWRPRLGTVFDGGPARWERLARRLLPPSEGPRPGSGSQRVLLLAYALVALLLDPMLRRMRGRILGLALPVLAACLGLAWTSPARADLSMLGFALDLGGGGGRRVDALLLAAGEGGWSGEIRWQGGGIVRLLGAAAGADDRIRLDPGRRAWVVREAVGEGFLPDEKEDPRGAIARRLVVGEVTAARSRYGRMPRLPVRVEGEDPPPAWTLIWR